jgi:hypothetical protein
MAAGRALMDAVSGVRPRPRPVLDSVLEWVAQEAGRYRASAPPARLAMRARAVDAALVALGAAPLAAHAL